MHSTPAQDVLSSEKNDDLDLLLIIKRAVLFLKNNRKKLLLASLVGLFCGVIMNFSFPKYYTSKLLTEPEVISNTEAKAIVESWDGMLRPSGRPYLMKAFNCSEETLRNTLKLAGEPLNPQNESAPGLFINVEVRDTSKLHDLQNALLNGFKNNDYIRRRVEQHIQGMQTQIGKANEELNKLDSTKEFIEGTFGSVRQDKAPLILDISNLSKEKLDLEQTKATLQEKLEFVDGILLIQGFTAAKGPKPGLLTLLVVGLVGGFLVGYVLIALQSLNRKLSKLKSN